MYNKHIVHAPGVTKYEFLILLEIPLFLYKTKWIFLKIFKLVLLKEITSLQTAAICPSSIHVSVTTSVRDPPAKYSMTTYVNKQKGHNSCSASGDVFTKRRMTKRVTTHCYNIVSPSAPLFSYYSSGLVCTASMQFHLFCTAKSAACLGNSKHFNHEKQQQHHKIILILLCCI